MNLGTKPVLRALLFTIVGVLSMESLAAPATNAKKSVKGRLPQKVVAPVKAPAPPQVRRTNVPVADPNQWLKAASGWTRLVRATDSTAGAYYAETLGLVIDSQFIIVPWTFISDAWLSRVGSKFMVEGSQREAVLADIDLVANVALLKVAEATVPTFYRTEIRLDAPVVDEPLLVLSSRNWVRGGAKFLKTKNDGLFVRYQIAIGATDPSSVRYIFDRAGHFIAMSSGASSGDDVWSAPSRAIYELIRKQSGPRPASVGDQRRTQLFFWQDRWARTLIPARAALSLQSLDCQTRLASVADRELAAQIKNVHALECAEKLPLPVGGGYSAGVHISTGEANLRSSSPDLNNRFAEAISSGVFAEFDRATSVVNLLTAPECRDNELTNQQGLNVHVKFCTSALKFEPGLADTAIVVSTLDQANRANYAVARLRGFDQKNTKMVLESLVENVRSLK